MSHARPAGDFLHRDADHGVTRAPAVVRLPLLLTTLFPGAERVVRIEAAIVADVVDGLEARWPGMRDRLCDTTPAIRRHINVFVEGRRAKLDTPLAPGADVYVLTAVSGG
jgi:sulfur-carrier protein